jgi:putative transposase
MDLFARTPRCPLWFSLKSSLGPGGGRPATRHVAIESPNLCAHYLLDQASAPFVKDKQLRARLHAYLAGVCRNHDSPSLIVGGVEDHVHVLCHLSKNIAPTDLLRELNSESSVWIKAQDPALNDLYWQGGYAIFSISPSCVDGLIACIADQESHHQSESLQNEVQRIFRKYGMEIDERYAWD